MAKKKTAMIVHFDEDGNVVKVMDGKGNALKKKRTEKQKIQGIKNIVSYQLMTLQPKGSDETAMCIHLPTCQIVC